MKFLNCVDSPTGNVHSLLANGGSRAEKIAKETMEKVRQAMGL